MFMVLGGLGPERKEVVFPKSEFLGVKGAIRGEVTVIHAG